MRRVLLLPLALLVSLGASCPKRPPDPPTHYDVRPTDPNICFPDWWPEDFEVCFEMERSGEKPCLTVRELRIQFARLHRVSE